MKWLRLLPIVTAASSLAVVVACSSSTTSNNPTGGNPEAGGGDDGSVTLKDGSAVKDTGASKPDGRVTNPACTPADVTNFTPAAYKGIVGATQGKCSDAQINDYYASCLDDQAPQGACNTKWGTAATANKDCGACLATQDSAAKWGALISRKGLVTVNLPGCVEAKGDATCAADLQAESLCTNAACFSNCPVTDNASLDDYRKCSSDAAQAGCKKYGDKADACRAKFADAGAGTAADCFGGQAFQDLYLVSAKVICGGTAVVVDSGTDTGTAADTGVTDAATGG